MLIEERQRYISLSTSKPVGTSMKRRFWLVAIVSVSIITLIGVFTTIQVLREMDTWASATPQNIVRTRTGDLLAAAQLTPSGPIPAQFQTEGIDLNCWNFLQSATATRQPPSITVAPNGTSALRDDDLIVTITYNDGRGVRLFYLAGAIIDCRPAQSQ